MHPNLAKALTLVNQKKFKKALPLIKKVNQKKELVDFASTELEALCLYNEKCYPLAKIKFLTALEFAKEPQQKLVTFKNLAAVSEKMGDQGQVIAYLKQLIDGDKSFEFRAERLALVEFATKNEDYECVKMYAPGLVKFKEYTMRSLLMLSKAFLETNETQSAIKLLVKAEGEIRLSKDLHPPTKDLEFVIRSFALLGETNKAKDLWLFLEKEYGKQNWHVNLKNQLNGKKKETSPKQHSQDGSKKVIAPQEGRVTGSSPEIIKLLEKLIHQLEDMGAEFHPGMVIKEEGGELSVFCHQKISNLEKFMNVPLTAMPLTADYRFSLEQDDKLVATPKKHRVSPKNVHIMETIVELFNATDKLGKWRKTYPIFKLAGKHKLANKLFHAKSHNQKYLKYFAQSHEEVTDESVIDSFLGSRTFAFRDSDMKRAGIKLKTPRQQGIIPLIELINHKISAPPFVIDHKSPYLSTFVADMESDEEVYVQYNLDDPVITFIVYGFIDTSAPWIYSVPVTLYSSLGQEIKISNLIGSLEAGKLPDNLKHLSTFVPSQSITVQNTINWSSLIIPKVEEQDIILKVLGYLIRTSYGVPECDDPGWVENEAEYLLRKLIKYNIQYWQEMSDLLNQTQDLDKDASELISQLCNLCLSMVKRYSQHNAYLLRA